MEGASRDQLAAAAKRNGMQSLRDAGFKAIYEGLTTIDEVARETIVEEET
jgi:type IV pilus assembly protein PilB